MHFNSIDLSSRDIVKQIHKTNPARLIRPDPNRINKLGRLGMDDSDKVLQKKFVLTLSLKAIPIRLPWFSMNTLHFNLKNECIHSISTSSFTFIGVIANGVKA